MSDLLTLPSIQAAAAVTASAVSANGSKWIRLTYFFALEASAKNLSLISSSDVLESFFSSVICWMMHQYSNNTSLGDGVRCKIMTVGTLRIYVCTKKKHY